MTVIEESPGGANGLAGQNASLPTKQVEENEEHEKLIDGAAPQDVDVDTAIEEEPLEAPTQAEVKKPRIKAARVEVKLFERADDSRGYSNLKALKSKKRRVARWQEYVLCLIHEFNAQRRLIGRAIRINSPIIKDTLKRVIVAYPGISFQTEEVELDLPSYCLYHYLPDLKAELDSTTPDSDAHSHMRLFVSFVEEEFERALTTGVGLIKERLITYDLLWILFKPKTLVFAKVHDMPRVFNVVETEYVCGQQQKYHVKTSYTDFDGKRFGIRMMSFGIPPFYGSMSIDDLNIFPLDFHAKKSGLTDALIDRGRKFERLRTVQCCQYDGILIEEVKDNFYDPSIFNKYEVSSRAMVDVKSYARFKSNVAFTVAPFPTPKVAMVTNIEDNDDDDRHSYQGSDRGDWAEEVVVIEPLTDEQCLVTTSTVCGFAFHGKRWANLCIDYISLVAWNEHAFDRLVLPSSRKDLVQALVQTHTQGASSFDDIIKGKGKGLVFVLHGPPGVGKTLTAECVAEHCQRPLYVVSSGELGTDPETLEDRLQRILDIAAVWKAVLLIDEADVFLEKRTLNDVHRNTLVSIFLKLLEYYEGILFLTTNRINTFDEAFRSRIHVALKLHDLESSAREKIWRTLLSNVDDVDISIDDASFEKLGRFPMNGRQIKNAIKTGECLAKHKGVALSIVQLEDVLALQMEFDEHFSIAEN